MEDTVVIYKTKDYTIYQWGSYYDSEFDTETVIVVTVTDNKEE